MTRNLIMYFRRHTTLLAGATSIIGVLGFAQTSRADWLPSINDVTEGLLAAAGGLAGFFGFYIANFLNYVMVKLFTFAGYLIDLGITLNQGILQHGLVRVGWLITRDVANLGFTVGMIAIAFATILRVEQYSVKKLLGKLVFAALLINFSLTIPGVILDGTHVFSKFFMSKVTGDEIALSRFSESIAAAFNIQELTRSPIDAALNVNNIAEVFVLISSVLFLALFGTLGVIALGATAYMVFYRYMVLTLLFIIAPLAWIALFLPGFSKYWSEWWDTFFKWALFLPFMTFFFYLAMYTAQSLGDVSIMNIVNGYPVSTSLASVPSIGRLAGVLGQMVVILGLMIGGLMVSQKMGIAGAAAAIGMAANVKKFTLGAIKGAAVGTVAGPAKYLGARPVKAGAMGLANLLNRPALRWIPGAKGAVAGLSGFGKRLEEVEAYRKQYLSNLSNEQLHQTTKTGIINKLAAKIPYVGKVLTTSLIDSPVDTAATLSEHIKRKQLSKLFEDVKDDPKKKAAMVELFAAAAQKVNPGTDAKDIEEVKALLGFKPTLTSKITDGKLTIYEGARKFMSADKAHEIDVEDANSIPVISALTENHWKDLVENPSTPTEVLIGAQNTLEKLAGPELVKLQKEYALAQIEIDRAKEEGVPENDEIALDDRGRRMKDASGKFIIARKGLKTMRRERKTELNMRRDELYRNASTITDEDRENYADVIKNKRMNEPNFIENLKRQFKTQYNRELSDDEVDNELIFIERGRAYKQLEDMKKQVGGLFYRPYNPKGGGGSTPPPGGPAGGPPGGPIAGGAPTAPRTVPEMMGELRAKRAKEAEEAAAKAKAEAEAKRAEAGTAGFLGEIEEAEKRAEATMGERVAADRKEGGEELPPPSLPGTRPPTPPPSRPPTPAPARTPTPTPPAQPTQVPPRAPTPAPERTPTAPSQREATATPPRETTAVPPRAPTRATAEQGVEAEARRRAEREEAAKRAREEAEATAKAEEVRAEAARRTAEAAKETTEAEEARLKIAKEKAKIAGEEAEKTKEELDTLAKIAEKTGDRLKTTEKIGETEKGIAEEIEKAKQATEKTADAAKKIVQEFAPLKLRRREDFLKAFGAENIDKLRDAEITTPADKRKRIIKNILRNNINPMQTTIVTADDERIDINQLLKYAEKSNAPIEVKKIKKT